MNQEGRWVFRRSIKQNGLKWKLRDVGLPLTSIVKKCNFIRVNRTNIHSKIIVRPSEYPIFHDIGCNVTMDKLRIIDGKYKKSRQPDSEYM